MHPKVIPSLSSSSGGPGVNSPVSINYASMNLLQVVNNLQKLNERHIELISNFHSTLRAVGEIAPTPTTDSPVRVIPDSDANLLFRLDVILENIEANTRALENLHHILTVQLGMDNFEPEQGR